MLTELALAIALLVVTVSGAGSLFHAAWERALCAHLAFETTHARLNGRPLPSGARRVRLNEDEREVTGHAVCGRASEMVTLPRLEAAQW